MKSLKLLRATLAVDRFPRRDCYPFSLGLFSNPIGLGFESSTTFFYGDNGCGKTSLLKGIARACGIHISEEPGRERFHYNQYEDKLQDYMEIEWAGERAIGHYFSARDFDFFARMLDEWAAADPGQLKYFGGKSLIEQSHGQSLMSFFKSRYALEGIYFLDEPETALSPTTQIQLVKLLREYGESGVAQFIIASHSPIILALPGAKIIEVGAKGLSPIAYEDTAPFRVYRDFLNDREKFLSD